MKSLVGFIRPCCADKGWKVNQRLALSTLDVLWGSGGKNAALHGNASPQNHPSVKALTVFVHNRLGSSVGSTWKRKVTCISPGDLDSLRLVRFPIIG